MYNQLNYNLIMELKLRISQLSASHYEIGRKLGEATLATKEQDYFERQLAKLKDGFLYQALGTKFELNHTFIDECNDFSQEKLLKYHPDLLDEIKGFAEGMNQPLDKTLAFLLNYGNGRGCTHLFTNGLHGHNYDDHPKNIDMQFLIILPTNSFKTAGFSLAQIGRVDGINEKGLAVSLSWGGGELPKKLGLSAELFIRIILDKANSVEEALELFNNIGYGSPNNIMISDANDNAVVIENSGNKHNVRMIKKNTLLYCANRYLSPNMQSDQKYENPTTLWREKLIVEKFNRQITKVEMVDLLTMDYPYGLFEPYYSEELGTLWSVIFEPRTRQATIYIGEKSNRVGKKIDLKNIRTTDYFEEITNTVPESTTSAREYSIVYP